MTSPLYELDQVSVSQANKELTINEMVEQLEARAFRVKSKSTSAQPGSPSNGDAYILPASPTGSDWSGNGGKLASYVAGIWSFNDVYTGMPIYVEDEGVDCVYDGSNWLQKSVDPMLSKDVAGSSDVTLSSAEASNRVHEYTGAITANINVIVPDDARLYHCYNNTSGAFTLTVKTSAGTGIAVGQGNRAILYCDGTNVVRFAADV